MLISCVVANKDILGVFEPGPHENVILLAPPLIIEKSDINWAFKRINAVINQRAV